MKMDDLKLLEAKTRTAYISQLYLFSVRVNGVWWRNIHKEGPIFKNASFPILGVGKNGLLSWKLILSKQELYE